VLVYGIEWEVAAEGNSGTDLGQHNVIVFWFKIPRYWYSKMGRYDSYTKLSQGEIDQFNDYCRYESTSLLVKTVSIM
jgi:hypothetical protein